MSFQIKKIILSSDFASENKTSSDYQNQSTDVIVLADEDEEDEDDIRTNCKYVASFFAFDYFDRLNKEHFKNGEYLNGTYFHSKNMVLINNCNHENISTVVKHLISEGVFFEVFRKL